MNPIRIEIPQFVRKLKVSNKQIANYFEWNGTCIKGKGKTLPISYYANKYNIPTLSKIEDLKQGFVMGFLKGGKIVSTCIDSSLITIDTFNKTGRWVLCKTVGNVFEPVISNPQKVGTPRFYLIKGQDIYSGNLSKHFKGMVMDMIKQSYLPYVQNMPVIDTYPIKIECELHDTIKNSYMKNKKSDIGERWDVDNYVYPYCKAFPDLLTALGKIRDDDRLHLPSSIGVRFIPIDNHENRKLVFTISLDDREEIATNQHFMKFHSGGYERDSITGETEDNDLRDIDFIPETKQPDTYGY